MSKSDARPGPSANSPCGLVIPDSELRPAPGRLPRRSLLGLLALAACDDAGQPVTPTTAIAPPAGSPLRPLGGLWIDRAVLGGGGWSSMVLRDDLSFHAVSDRGRWLSARLVVDGGAKPIGLARVRSGPLRGPDGVPLAPGYLGDAESLLQDADGIFVVGFERWARLRRYDGFGGPGRYVEPPPGLENAPFNGGLEALALLADGRWLGIAERQHPAGQPDRRRAWIGGPGRWQSLEWALDDPLYDPTEARGLPDGGALVLERQFSITTGFLGRLRHIPSAALAAAGEGTVLQGTPILTMDDDRYAGNWEAMGVCRYGGRTLVALMTDDNELYGSRTRLLLYTIELG